MIFDREKFKRLVHYVAWSTRRRGGLDLTQLNEVLWFADAQHHVVHGRAITGATYTRERCGPMADAIRSVRAELLQEGQISIERGGSSDRIVAFHIPELALFSTSELASVDRWIQCILDTERARPSEDSNLVARHDVAWKSAQVGEVLPYIAYLAQRVRRPDDEELAWARTEAKRIGRKF